jgi:hypothetical protein
MRSWIFVAPVAAILMLGSEKARACQGQHFAVNGTSSGDTGCIFNVNVSVDQATTDAQAFFGNYGFDQQLANDIAQGVDGQSAGSSVNLSQTVLAGYGPGEGTVAFTIPAGAQEVTITVTDAAGGVASATEVLANTAPGAGGPCSPDTANPPPPSTFSPPLNTADPGPGMSPGDTAAGLNEQLQTALPMSSGSGSSEALLTKRVQ